MTDQGQSEFTEGKQASLRRILGQHMSICENIYKKGYRGVDPCYHYFDIYAGCGWNEEVDVEGSPIVFVGQAGTRDLIYRGYFIERDPVAALRLSQMIEDNPMVEVYQDDNAERLPPLLDTIDSKRKTFGLIYADPNGMPCFDVLADASRHPACERIDILIYASATTIKRVRKAYDREDLASCMSRIAKRKWLIQEPRGHQQWTFLLGTNYDGYNSYRGIQLFGMETARGKEILRRLNYTEAELTAQQQLPFAYKTYGEYRQLPEFKAVRAQVYKRAGGVCERCHSAPVTEAHHIKYPPWGTIDVPENMIAVCHRCHCELHGKED